jgi:hypothetical protein
LITAWKKAKWEMGWRDSRTVTSDGTFSEWDNTSEDLIGKIFWTMIKT